MRLVTNDPVEYFTWFLFGLLGVAILIGVMFFIAWFQVYVIAPYKRKKRKETPGRRTYKEQGGPW